MLPLPMIQQLWRNLDRNLPFLIPFLLALLLFPPGSRGIAPPTSKETIQKQESTPHEPEEGFHLASTFRILIDKTARTLMLFKGNSLMALYPVALGPRPIGDKSSMNDGRTPQGSFYICRIDSRSPFRWSFLLSYPNAEDARRGLEQGSVDQDMNQLILRAIRNREIPPQGTALGGGIQIQGGGTGSDWTQGSIALSNEHVEQLSRFVRVGTPVQIR